MANQNEPKGFYWDVMRPGIMTAFRTIGAAVYSVAPSVVRGAEQASADVYEALHRSKHTRPCVVPLAINGVRFQLSLVANHPKGQQEYQRLSTSNDVYEPVMVECVTRILAAKPEAPFFDVGAFMGYYAAYVAALSRDRRRVVAIESNPRYVDVIRRTIGLNGWTQASVHEAALSDGQSTVAVEGETVVTGGQSGVQRTSSTFDDVCRQIGVWPGVIKIDVHGAEGKVVRGMSEALRRLDYLLLEVHPLDALQKYSPGVRRSEILDALDAAGLHVYYVSGHRHRRSEGLQSFAATGTFAYRKLDRATRDLLLFDRHIDIFLLASRRADIESLLGPSAIQA